MTDLFLRFKAHYGFEVTFCNPYAGHEKGNVENKVGYFRRNVFVPLPVAGDTCRNEELLGGCEADWQREHYKKNVPIQLLFEDDKKALLYLLRHPFTACRYARVKTEGYGKFSIDGKYFYSSSPE
ncbi:hypothetical protein B0G52_118152 [Cohnella sp. SGD-V74]|uniref:transposase n=1 Tax=unclassified Cohnella TaxID=2636738 RepID=UPI000D4276F1|nr:MULTISPECIES: transposase [unclassified Cohnella]PRX65199.1 hypothetical protein B0G52_118152 [Cohnella sp. SGD-V74]